MYFLEKSFSPPPPLFTIFGTVYNKTSSRYVPICHNLSPYPYQCKYNITIKEYILKIYILFWNIFKMPLAVEERKEGSNKSQ